jgi:hypothetical protein
MTGLPERRQERIGWLGGWLGGFIWVAILAAVFLVQGRQVQAAIGLLITIVACGAIVLAAPWRHPATPYRTLMLPIYALFLVAVAWAVWTLGDARALGINSWWGLLLLLPALLPLWTVGNRRWGDGDT